METLSRIASIVSSWWKNFTMNDDERYLSQAVDHVDFENRMRVVLDRTRYSFNFNPRG